MGAHLLEELKAHFRDCLNDEAEDPLAPIDPLTSRTPEGGFLLAITHVQQDMHGCVSGARMVRS